jgi:hypothetical protein
MKVKIQTSFFKFLIYFLISNKNHEFEELNG